MGGHCNECIHYSIIRGGDDVGDIGYINFVWSFQMCVLWSIAVEFWDDSNPYSYNSHI